MSGKKYNVAVANGTYTDEQGNTKTRWMTVGAIVENRNGNLNLILNVMPPPVMGNERVSWLMNVFPHEPRQGSQGGQAPSAAQSGDNVDDDIPFVHVWVYPMAGSLIALFNLVGGTGLVV